MDQNNQSLPPEEIERTSPLGETSSPSTEPTPEPTREVKPKKSKAPMMLGLLLVVALAACGAVGWMYYDQSNQKATLESQIDEKDKKINKLTSQLNKVTAPAAQEEEAETNDTDAIISAITTFDKAINPQGTTTFEITKRGENFASVHLAVEGTSPSGILKKVDDQWVVIFYDIADIPQATIDKFDIPSEIVSTIQG